MFPSLFCRYDGHPNPESVLPSSLAWFQFDPESVRRSRIPPRSGPSPTRNLYADVPRSMCSQSILPLRRSSQPGICTVVLPGLVPVRPGICTAVPPLPRSGPSPTRNLYADAPKSLCSRSLLPLRRSSKPGICTVVPPSQVSRLTRNLYGSPAASPDPAKVLPGICTLMLLSH